MCLISIKFKGPGGFLMGSPTESLSHLVNSWKSDGKGILALLVHLVF
jgi:hypothetical protein